MKKIIFIGLLFIIATVSCTKNFDALNLDPSKLPTPDFEPVLTQVFKVTADRSATENLNYFWEYTHLIEPTGQRYNSLDNALWSDYYITGINNIRQLRKLYDGNPKYINRMAIANIWDCYLYAYLVGSYGPIPYSQAGSTEPVVAYDDENSICTSLLSRLKDASAAISGNMTGDKLSTDYIYGGDLTKWLKFSNSLRLRLALRYQRNIPDAAIAAIKDVMANEATLLQSDADNAKLQYGTADGSQNPYYVKYIKNVVQAVNYPIMSDFVFTYFRSYNDPRMTAYFNKSTAGYNIRDTLLSTADAFHYIVTYNIPYCGAPKAATVLPGWNIINTTWAGGTYPTSFSTLPGVTSTIPITTPSGINLVAADRPFYFMTYAELLFMKAEAAQLGYLGNTGASAQSYYQAGINANFAFWGLTPAQATAYQAQNGVKFGTSARGFNYVISIFNSNIPSDDMTKIWIQRWINYFDDGGFDAWCLLRRTRCVTLPPHTGAGTPSGQIFPLFVDLSDRSIYSTQEPTVNPVGYQSGVALLGGSDYQTTPLKFAMPYTHINWNTLPAILDYSMCQKWYGPNIQSLTAAGVPFVTVSKY
jgi:hypothetical protein